MQAAISAATIEHQARNAASRDAAAARRAEAQRKRDLMAEANRLGKPVPGLRTTLGKRVTVMVHSTSAPWSFTMEGVPHVISDTWQLRKLLQLDSVIDLAEEILDAARTGTPHVCLCPAGQELSDVNNAIVRDSAEALYSFYDEICEEL